MFCKRLGGSLESRPYKYFRAFYSWAPPGRFRNDNFSLAPFAGKKLNIGVLYGQQKIFYCGKFEVSNFIHEMAHVFASAKPPDSSEEFEFLGWEYAVARKLGCIRAWKKGMAGYGVSACQINGVEIDVDEFSQLSHVQVNELLAERLKIAKKNKLVSKTGQPLSIR